MAQKRKRNINLNICIHFTQYCFATSYLVFLTTDKITMLQFGFKVLEMRVKMKVKYTKDIHNN